MESERTAALVIGAAGIACTKLEYRGFGCAAFTIFAALAATFVSPCQAQRTGCGGLSGDEYTACMKNVPRQQSHNPHPPNPEASLSNPEAFSKLQESERRRQNKKTQLDNQPVVPWVGMSAAQFEALRMANYARLSDFQRTHPFDIGDDGKYDIRWGEWSGCLPNRTITADGVREQWVCGGSSSRRYVYIVNGIVTAIQE